MGNSRLELFCWASSDVSHFHPLLTAQHTSVEGKSPVNYGCDLGALKSKFLKSFSLKTEVQLTAGKSLRFVFGVNLVRAS